MKRITIFLLLIYTMSSNGQQKSKDKSSSDFRRVQIGINISPDVCFRTLKNNDASWSSDLVISERNKSERVKPGYTTGLNVCFNIKKYVGLETGIQYSNKGYQTKQNLLIFGQPSPGLPSKLKLIYHYHYIDIPLKANFTIGKKKLRFFGSLGITTNIFIKETATTIITYSNRTDRKTEPTNDDYKRVNLSPALSAGIDYALNSRMNIRVEPIFRFGVLKIIDAPVTGYLYNGGINISYYFGL